MTEPFGPHHSFMRSGSVKHFQTRSRGASNEREMTKSALFVSLVIAFSTFRREPTRSLHEDHPADAEFIGEHAETRREEGFAQRHRHLTAGAQGFEQFVGLGLAVGRNRQCKAMKRRRAAV